jgi:hypothetical protein
MGVQMPLSQMITLPAPYCLGGMVPLESGVGDGMVLNVDCHAFFSGVVAGAFGDRPALHGPIEFQPKVVVQPACPMLLDHETQILCGFFPALCWLRCDGEVSLGLVESELVVGGHRNSACGLAALFELRLDRGCARAYGLDGLF